MQYFPKTWAVWCFHSDQSNLVMERSYIEGKTVRDAEWRPYSGNRDQATACCIKTKKFQTFKVMNAKEENKV
jgi:hypothetical protein